jgi:hypothetical protein
VTPFGYEPAGLERFPAVRATLVAVEGAHPGRAPPAFSARRVVEQHLGRTVDAHDDGSAPSMFDLRAGSADAPEIATEVTGAIDRPWVATRNASLKRSGQIAGVDGDWTSSCEPAPPSGTSGKNSRV